MQTYISSVFCAVLIITVLSLLLPEGRFSKFIKPFISLVLILIILSPLTDFESIIGDGAINGGTEISADGEFLIKTARAKIDDYRENCIRIAEKYGVSGAECVIEYTVNENYAPTVTGAEINLKNAVISSETQHIVIMQRLKDEISEYLSLPEKGVRIIE